MANNCSAFYWGNGTVKEVADDWLVTKRISDSLEAALEISGIRTNLWIPLTEGYECTCKKDESYDIFCDSCYGIGWIGGYRKYGYKEDIFNFDKAFYIDEEGNITFGVSTSYNTSEIEVKTDSKPSILTLKDSINTAIASWSGLDFSDIVNFNAQVIGSVKDAPSVGDGILVEISIDAGAWVDINTIIGNNYSGAHTADVRVTLTRGANGRSPAFEIIRFTSQVLDIPYILISRTRSPEDQSQERNGKLDIETGLSFWTLQDFELAYQSFIEPLESPFQGNRYKIFNFRRSFFWEDKFRQIFDGRIISRDREIFWKII